MNQDPPIAPWLFEIVGPVLFVLMCGYYVWQSRRAGQVTVPALVFLGGFTCWWQEWYGDWGSYVLYNPHLTLIPGYDLPLTSPNKPWAVIPAYGWFFGLVYFPVITVVSRLHGRLARSDGDEGTSAAPEPVGTGGVAVTTRPPSVGVLQRRRAPSRMVLLFAIGWPLFYLWDLLIEGVASVWGLWSYTHFLGPAIVTSRGNFPLLYPVIPFALMMTLTAMVIAARRRDGTPSVEAWLRVDRFSGGPRAAVRVLAWVLAMNLCYGLFFIWPTMIVRGAFLPDSSLVP